MTNQTPAADIVRAAADQFIAENTAPRSSAKTISSFDRHVAGRLKAARLQSGRSQTDAAVTLGVAFQQVQKYEQGTNRISAGKLFLLAELYSQPIEWFFEGLKREQPEIEDRWSKLLCAPHGSELVTDFLAIPSSKGQAAVAAVAAAFAVSR